MGISRTSVHRWCSGKIDPTGDSVVEIVRILKSVNKDAAKDFVGQLLRRRTRRLGLLSGFLLHGRFAIAEIWTEPQSWRPPSRQLG